MALPLLLSLALLPPAIRAQNAPDCPASVNWLDNAKGQDPCHVQSWLYSQCSGVSNYTLWALGTTYSGYPGPTSQAQSDWTFNGCLCSMPVYNLAMACQGACQAKNIILWDEWTSSCNSSYTGSTATPTLYFPQTVPDGTVIPPWATIDNSDNPWSEAEAQQNVSSALQSSISLVSSTTASGNPTASVPVPSGSGKASSATNTGAIAGGVVGGLVVVAVLGALGMFLFRRQRRRGGAEGAAGAQPQQGTMQQVPLAQYLDQSGSPSLYSHARGSPANYGTSEGGYPHSGYGAGVSPFGTSATPVSVSGGSSHHPASTYPEVMSPSDVHSSEPDTYPAFHQNR